jgi:polyvinyl alcohol dehydrogenase (cytochrome)
MDVGVGKMPYRILCNNVKRESAKPSSDLVSGLFCYVPFHNIRYGIVYCVYFSLGESGMKRFLRSKLILALIVLVMIGVSTFAMLARQNAARAATGDWPTFLGSNARTGYNAAENTITSSTAANLKVHWVAQSSAHLSGEPVEANGLVYWGDWNGVEHATNPSTGKEVWATSLGSKPGPCTPVYGVTGSATFASVSINGVTTPAVFVSGGTIKLYALNANTGAILWQSSLGAAADQFIFGSTAVFNGSVYVGIASDIDCPLVQGQMVQVNASTGAIQHVFSLVPSGCIGGGVWGSPTIDDATGMLYFGTGNRGKCSKPEPYAQAVVELNASTFSLVGSWQVPGSDAVTDGDYGSTPTLFQATIQGTSHSMVGLVNKDGYYYALDRTKVSAGALWKVRISVGGSSPETGNGSISSSAYDGSTLYAAGGITTIGGRTCHGSLRALDPNTGAFLWQMCLSNPVLDSVAAIPGLVVVGSGNTMSVVNSATGNTLYSYRDPANNGRFWGAASISNGILYDGSRSGKLFAFGL